MIKKVAFIFVILFICVTTLVAQNISEKRRTIIFGGDVDFYPYEFIDDHGSPEGFNVDLINAASKRMGLRCVLKIGKWVEIRKELDEHKVDLVSMMYSMERAKQYKIGPTIKYVSYYAVYIKGRTEIDEMKDLTGRRVVVESGTLSGEIIKNQDIKCHLFYSTGIKEALIDLSKGKYDAMVCESEAAEYNLKKLNLDNLEIGDINIAPRELCFTGNDGKLLMQMDETIYQMKKDGSYDKIYEKWFNHNKMSKTSRTIYVIIGSLLLLIVILYVVISILRHSINKAKRQLQESNDRLKLALSTQCKHDAELARLNAEVRSYANRIRYVLKMSHVLTWFYDLSMDEITIYIEDEHIYKIMSSEDYISLCEPECQAEARQNYENVIHNKLEYIHVQRKLSLNKDSTEGAYYVINGIAIKNDQGIIVKYFGICTDITNLINIQHELEKEMIKAKESDRLKSEFLANMSHEIRTPLNSIVGFSNILETATDEEEKHQCVQLINQNSDMLLRLINDILDFSRLEAGIMDFQMKEFNLSDLFESAYSLFLDIKREKDIELKCELPDESCIIKADYNRLLQILTNFVTNAFKYTEHGYVKMSYHSENGGVKLMVEDTGVGISKEKLDKVFHRFEKIGSLRQGTGLGLSICQAIIASFDGKIGVESECGKGSIFWVWFPLR